MGAISKKTAVVLFGNRIDFFRFAGCFDASRRVTQMPPRVETDDVIYIGIDSPEKAYGLEFSDVLKLGNWKRNFDERGLALVKSRIR